MFSPRCDSTSACCSGSGCSWTWDTGTANSVLIYAQLNSKAVVSFFNQNSPLDPGYDPTNLSFESPGSNYRIYFNELINRGACTIRVWFSGLGAAGDQVATPDYSYENTELVTGVNTCMNGVTYAPTDSITDFITLIDNDNYVDTVDSYTDESDFTGGYIFDFACGDCTGDVEFESGGGTPEFEPGGEPINFQG
jgi:hypothetical protein